MNSKERVLRTLRGEKTDQVPAGVHGWGMYKFAHMGYLSDYSREKEMWNIQGEKLARIESRFQNDFNPDFLQCAEAFFESKKKIINDPAHRRLHAALKKLESRQIIEEFLDLVYESPDVLARQKKFDHLKILSKKYGDDIFIMLTTEGPVHDLLDEDGVLGFQEGMLAMIDNPRMFVHLLEGMYVRQLDFVRAVKNAGAHGYSQSFSYLSSDMVSPCMYAELAFPIQRDFFAEVEKIGLIPILSSWGWVTPIVRFFKKANIRGLMVEESRKNFTNDIGEIKGELGEEIGLFGNVSGEHTLLHGTVEDVRRDVIGQIQSAGRNGGFISSSGTPIAFGTPPENVRALIETGKEYRMEQ